MQMSSSSWAKKFNDECEGFGYMKTRYVWEPCDFDLEFGEEFDPIMCHDDYGKAKICDSCKHNIDEFNKPILTISLLKNKIAKLEAFIHAKFPEYDILDDEKSL